jgi:hypothetical protein
MKQGFSLGSVLLAAAIAMVAAFSLAGLATSGLNMAHRYSNQADALGLAEAALAEGLGRLHADRTFGTHRETIQIQPDPSRPKRRALLTFDPGRASAAIPLSTAELPSEGSGGSVHLIGVGQAGGVTRAVEMLLTIPPFQFAVGVAGSLNSGQGFEVSGQDADSPGNLACNGKLNLQGPSRITGDLFCAGPLDALMAPFVGGRTITGETSDLPFLDVSAWDPRRIPELDNQRSELESAAVRDFTVTGAMHTNPGLDRGNLLVNGNLNLDKGLLCVDGDLTVRGKIVGNGGVVVLGNVRVEGAVDVAPADAGGSQVALLTRGKADLLDQQGANFFQGLAYVGGDFSARKTDMTGVFIQGPESAGVETSSSSFTLDQAKIRLNESAAKMNIVVETAQFGAGDVMLPGFTERFRVPSELQLTGREGQLVRERFTDLAAAEQAARDVTADKPYAPGDFFPDQTGGVSPSCVYLPLPNWKSKLPNVRIPGTNQKLGDGGSVRTLAQNGRASQELFLAVTAHVPGSHPVRAGANGFVEVTDTVHYTYTIVARPQAGNSPPIDGTASWDRTSINLKHDNEVEAERRAEAIAKAFYGGTNHVSAMKDSIRRMQMAWRDTLNAKIREIRGPVQGPTKRFERALDVNKFRNDDTPFKILAWRERR